MHGSHDEPAPIDVARAARDADELVRAALSPHHRAAAALGAHAVRATTRLEVREGDSTALELTVETAIEIDASGAFHAVSNNSRDYGREVFYTGGQLYLAPRYSKLHRRAPESPDEPQRILDDLAGELGAHLELLSRSLAVEDRGAVTHAGRAAQRIGLARAAKPRRPSGLPAGQARGPDEAWRDELVADAIEGEVILDSSTGAPLAGTVRGTVTFRRDDRVFAMTVSVVHAIERVGEAIAVAAPPEDRWVATPLRAREAEERDQLLQGMAPPARKSAPAPGGAP